LSGPWLLDISSIGTDYRNHFGEASDCAPTASGVSPLHPCVTALNSRHHPPTHPYPPALPSPNTRPESRLRSIRANDDGLRMADVVPPPLLTGLIQGYSEYAEHTGSVTTRRELPHA